MNTRHATIADAFQDVLARDPERLLFRLVVHFDDVRELSYAAVYDLACRAAAGLRERGVRRGDRVVLGLGTSEELLAVYMGAVLSGVIPVVAPGLSLSGVEHHATRLLRLAGQIDARAVVIANDAPLVEVGAAGSSCARGPWCRARALVGPERADLTGSVDPDAVCHLQLTSGSTSEQKIAVVRHRNIVANVVGMGARAALQDDDQLFIWLPLFHDMGLIATACTLYWQRPMTLTPPSNFITNPIRYWWKLMSRYRATITAAPNSAYHACARLASRRKPADLDLTSCRLAFWGAEPIRIETIEAFIAAFGPCGYRPEATLPVYGLAEATLAVTMPDVGQAHVVDELDASALQDFDEGATRVASGAPGAASLRSVGVGHPLPGHSISLVRGGRTISGEGELGEIVVSGPSVVDGYWAGPDEAPEAGAEGRSGRAPSSPVGALPTGDLGYVRNGHLHIVGRLKDIIIVAGRNFLPTELEAQVDAVVQSGIPKGVAAVGIANADTKTEAVHLLIEARTLPVPDQAAVEDRVRSALKECFGISGAFIHWVPKGTIPKTTSDKIQRYRCAQIARQASAPGPHVARDGAANAPASAAANETARAAGEGAE